MHKFHMNFVAILLAAGLPASHLQASPSLKISSGSIDIPVSLNQAKTNDVEKTYCTNGPTNFAHSDGGVASFDSFCATFRESGDLTLGWNVTSNVTFINHRVHYMMSNEFFLKADPSKSYSIFPLGGAVIGCAHVPYPSTFESKAIYSKGTPSRLNEVSDKGVFHFEWYNEDNSLCSAARLASRHGRKR